MHTPRRIAAIAAARAGRRPAPYALAQRGGANAVAEGDDDDAAYGGPPPDYETAVAGQTYVGPVVPPRYRAPTEGRNSIVYSQLPPIYDTTKLFLVDNKSADIQQLNFQSDHSDFQTSVVQNGDFTPLEASTQTIGLDDRSRWGGGLQTTLDTSMPNVNTFMYSAGFRARLMSAYDETTRTPTYQWFDLSIPEGNFPLETVIDLMNDAIVHNYLRVGRQNGVREDQIGVKFDTRNFRLGMDPLTLLVMPGSYNYQAMHPDVVLLPGCAVDFTTSRLSNMLGWRKRLPFQEGFIISWDDLVGGNVPALLDLTAYLTGDEADRVIQPVTQDSKGRSYHVGEDPSVNALLTAYRSLYLAYNYGPGSDFDFNDQITTPPSGGETPGRSDVGGATGRGAKEQFLLTAPDVTGGTEQLYWSLPDLAQAPVTFKETRQTVQQMPVVGMELLPLQSRMTFNPQPVYSQQVNESTSQTRIFNRFPENAILMRPPAPSVVHVADNVPAITDHGTLPIKNSLQGVQRVVITDARRRTVPYVTKALGVVSPRVLSSRTF